MQLKSIFIVVVVVIVGVVAFRSLESDQLTTSPSPTATATPVVVPMDRFQERVTKKPFGVYFNQQNSPVQPERFVGYHTGTDFETFPSETSVDVSIRAICPGTLLRKSTAQGYGGYAVQSCTINNQAVTVVYGHLRLSSISAAIGSMIFKGTQLGVLGTGFSTETDGERKHLHLGIYKGTAINIRGYVQTSSEVTNWIDPMRVLE